MKGFNGLASQKNHYLRTGGNYFLSVSSFALLDPRSTGRKNFLRCMTIGKYKLHPTGLSVSRALNAAHIKKAFFFALQICLRQMENALPGGPRHPPPHLIPTSPLENISSAVWRIQVLEKSKNLSRVITDQIISESQIRSGIKGTTNELFGVCFFKFLCEI